jgi:anti-anti-sigma regulatory factor
MSVLRIDEFFESPSSVKLKPQGSLAGEWVLLLEERILRSLQTTEKVFLDFSELRFVDKYGLEMLRRLPSEKIEIINCPGFIEELLKE